MNPCAAKGFVLQSGTPTDGVFKASCLLPADTANGVYWFETHVYDKQNNYVELRVDDAFEVVGGATPDHVPPSITNMKYADSTVERGAMLSVTTTVTDLDAGVDFVNFQAAESYSETLLCRGAMHLESGDMTSGVWAFSCEVPMDMEIANYGGSVYAFDNQNNQAMWTLGFNVIMPTKA
jgi:hypothetical protein